MQIEMTERLLSLVAHICRVIALFLPWIVLSLTLVQNTTVLDSQTFILSMVYSNSMKFGELLTFNFADYMILSLITVGASIILILNEIYQIKRGFIALNLKESEFMRYLQLFSQISAVLLLVGVFSILSDIKFIHPLMTAEILLEGESRKLIVESNYSFGMYLWILSIILSGPETLSNINLVYSTLGGISTGKAEKISRKINSIIQYYIAKISTYEEHQREKDKPEAISEVGYGKLNNWFIENRDIESAKTQDTDSVDEFDKLFLKNK